jgi:integrase
MWTNASERLQPAFVGLYCTKLFARFRPRLPAFSIFCAPGVSPAPYSGPVVRNSEAPLQRRLTDAFARSQPAPAVGRLEIADSRCAGLVLRITATGARSWSYRYRDKAAGRLTRLTIGPYPAVSLMAARSQADAMRREVAGGGDPADRKRRDRAEAGAKSFGALAERYLAEHSRRHKRSHAADERNLRKHILPRWQRRAYASIKRADIIELVEAVVSAGHGTLANRLQSLISGIFTFALDAGLVESNPCYRLHKRGVEQAGRRVLSDPEIPLFWNGIVEPSRARRIGLGLRLALMTGARASEIAGIARAELERIGDPARSAWIVPGTRTKNQQNHLIPLSPLARSVVLDLLEMIEPGEPYLLPTRSRRRRGPMRSNSVTQGMANFAGRLKGADDAIRTWRADAPSPHDLRRTLGTRLAELQIPKEIRDRCLNHIPPDVGSRHYNLHDFEPEKRAAFNRWAAVVEAILSGSAGGVVVPMVRR